MATGKHVTTDREISVNVMVPQSLWINFRKRVLGSGGTVKRAVHELLRDYLASSKGRAA